MSEFYSLLNRPATVPASKGSIDKPVFEERVVDGVRCLVQTGKENLKDFIEASKSETLISNIIKRFELGDTSVLQRVQGFYGDFTSMPSNLAEAQNLLIRLNNQFDSLPVDIKNKFDYSFDKFVKDVSFSNVEDFKKIFGLETHNVGDSSGALPESEVE